jgi:uncharacterized protein (TIGR02996 family)
MSEESFLQAIYRNPRDDMPRLVYADWLDENSNSDRAEFIRLQFEIAAQRAGLVAASEENDRRQDWLEQRERELLEKNWQQWLRPLHSWILYRNCDTNILTYENITGNRAVVRFRKGFPGEVNLNTDTFLGIPCLAHARSGENCINCGGTGATKGAALTLLPELPTVTKISLADKRPSEWSEDAGSSSFDGRTFYSWFGPESILGLDQEHTRIPEPLFQLMMRAGHKQGNFGHTLRFETAADAQEALSEACLGYAQSLKEKL